MPKEKSPSKGGQTKRPPPPTMATRSRSIDDLSTRQEDPLERRAKLARTPPLTQVAPPALAQLAPMPPPTQGAPSTSAQISRAPLSMQVTPSTSAESAHTQAFPTDTSECDASASESACSAIDRTRRKEKGLGKPNPRIAKGSCPQQH